MGRLSQICASIMFSLLLAVTAQAQAGDEPKHIALVIGNTKYAAAPGAASSAVLPELPHACEDAETIEAALVGVGWDENDITRKCDLSTGDMIKEIRSFIQLVQDNPYSIAVFYYAGHGVQIDDRSYLFGVDARPNFETARRQIEHGATGQLFFNSALELYSDILNGVGNVTDGGFTVIIDACRSDPLIQSLGGRPRLVTTSLNKTTLVPTVLVAHSTQKGETAADNGAYANAIRAHARRGESLETILTRVNTTVFNATKLTSHPQVPTKSGGLILPCLAGCSLDTNDALDTAPPRTTKISRFMGGVNLPRFIRASFAQDDAQPTLPPVIPASGPTVRNENTPPVRGRAATIPIQTLYTDPALAEGKRVKGVRVDIFWCAGGTSEQAREALARLYGQRIVQLASSAKSGVLSVRLRPLSPNANDQVVYRFLRNSVVFDPADRAEAEVARAIARKGLGVVEELQSRTTPDYVSLFLCQTDTRTMNGVVYWQVPEDNQKPLATKLMDDLDETTGRFHSARQVEVITRSPPETQVRYYFPDDRDIAYRVADSLQWILKHEVSVRLLTNLSDKVQPGSVEAWIGINELSQPVTSSVQPGSITMPSRNTVLQKSLQAPQLAPAAH